MPDSATGLTVWRFIDGKRGHENQSLGLVRALQERASVQVCDIPVRRGWRNVRNLLLGRCPAAAPPGKPDLLIGAGHTTHLPMLACRRARGGRVVVLMRPTLPLVCFDRCVVPAHDRVPASPRVFVSRGALNPMRPAAKPPDAPGMILLGGPSREYAWDEAAIIRQVQAVVAADRRAWVVAGSRRTPPGTLPALREALAGSRVDIVAVGDVAADWLATELPKTALAWVSEDSVSMLYEALTAGAACGVLAVPTRRPGRVRRGVQALLDQGLVTPFAALAQGAVPQAPSGPFNEAARCAEWLLT